jgi:hypothetical protein
VRKGVQELVHRISAGGRLLSVHTRAAGQGRGVSNAHTHSPPAHSAHAWRSRTQHCQAVACIDVTTTSRPPPPPPLLATKPSPPPRSEGAACPCSSDAGQPRPAASCCAPAPPAPPWPTPPAPPG